jgi:hypothetical protein
VKVQATIAIATLSALAGRGAAQTVEFRIVQESATANNVVTAIPPAYGTELNSANATGNFAVQARVTAGPDGSALGGFSFDIVMPGEADTNGTLAKLRIMSTAGDGTYYAGAATANAGVGTGGIARQYSYLAGINSQFNGLINTSGGTFTNQPGQQEIGLITGSATGSALLGTPNISLPGPNPVPVDPILGPQYFAQGQFIDLYRFRYTMANFSGRLLNFTLANVTAQVFNQFFFNNGSWAPQDTTVAPGNITTTGLAIPIGVPAPTSSALLGLGSLVAFRRRRAGISRPSAVQTGSGSRRGLFLGWTTCGAAGTEARP